MKFNTYVYQESMEGDGMFSASMGSNGSMKQKKDIKTFTEKVFERESVFHPLELHNINGQEIHKVLSETIKNLFIEKDKEISHLRKELDEVKKAILFLTDEKKDKRKKYI